MLEPPLAIEQTLLSEQAEQEQWICDDEKAKLQRKKIKINKNKTN